VFGIDQVHRPALAAGATGDLAVQLRDHGVHVAAFGEVRVVAAVCGEEDIFRFERLTYSGRYGFLTYRQVDRTFDLVRPVHVDDLLFDPTHAKHRAVELLPELFLGQPIDLRRSPRCGLGVPVLLADT